MNSKYKYLFGLVLTLMITGCSGSNNPPSNGSLVDEDTVNIDNEFTNHSNILVAYFSKTNTTENVANIIQSTTNADIFQIERKEPYPSEYTPTTEVARKEKDDNARPELKSYIPRDVMAKYDTIFLGYPIWWGTAPMPVLSFLNFYEFSNTSIYTFCTAATSSITGSTSDIRSNAKGATVVEGKRFSRNDESGIKSWIDSLNISISSPSDSTSTLTFERNDVGFSVTGETNNETEIVIPNQYQGLPVTEIAESAFAINKHRTPITKITIADSIETIGLNAFYNQSELESVVISENSSLKTIENNAFSGASSLVSIFLPKTLTHVGSEGDLSYPGSVFNGTGSLEEIIVDEDNSVFTSTGNALIEKSTGKLIRGTNNTKIPEIVTTIGERAFTELNKMSELVIPKTVKKIENYIISWTDTSIKTIRFLGNEEEWNEVEKANSWDNDNTEYTLVFGEDIKENNILIVYFSWSTSMNTEKIANHIKEQTNGDLVKIEAKEPYVGSYSDIAYGRAKEEHDTNARPEVAESTYTAIEMSKYKNVFVGYPIWWWTTPMIIPSFLEHYTWDNSINIYPFSQSASMDKTQFETSMNQIKESAKGANVNDGLFVSSSNITGIDNYLRTNGFID